MKRALEPADLQARRACRLLALALRLLLRRRLFLLELALPLPVDLQPLLFLLL